MSGLEEKIALELYRSKYENSKPSPRWREMRLFADLLIRLLFPQIGRLEFKGPEAIQDYIVSMQTHLTEVLADLRADGYNLEGSSEELSTAFLSRLPEVERELDLDARFILQHDPAAESLDEVIICYPGFKAIALYRLAHVLHSLKIPLLPRILTEYAHERTGIDIHPGARIQAPFYIDHGTGVVIGETTRIGRAVRIFQGVTLGALSVDKDMRGKQRHPTIEDEVIIYANAVILGGETVIGRSSVIGGGVWLTSSVPPKSQVYSDRRIT